VRWVERRQAAGSVVNQGCSTLRSHLAPGQGAAEDLRGRPAHLRLSRYLRFNLPCFTHPYRTMTRRPTAHQPPRSSARFSTANNAKNANGPVPAQAPSEASDLRAPGPMLCPCGASMESVEQPCVITRLTSGTVELEGKNRRMRSRAIFLAVLRSIRPDASGVLNGGRTRSEIVEVRVIRSTAEPFIRSSKTKHEPAGDEMPDRRSLINPQTRAGFIRSRPRLSPDSFRFVACLSGRLARNSSSPANLSSGGWAKLLASRPHSRSQVGKTVSP
jgi:hypothetical protein